MLPREQHFAIFGDLVLLLAGAEQAVRVDTLQPYENARHAGPAGFLDEMRQAVAHGVNLDDELDVDLLLLAHLDQAVEDALPVQVAGKIVVRDEEAVDSLRQIATDNLLHIVG